MKRLSIFHILLFLLASLNLQAQAPDSVAIQKKQYKKVKKKTVLDENVVDSTIVAIQNDSAKISKKGRKPQEDRFFYKVFKKDYPNPKTAMLLSFALPGTGQIYNRSWWKPPIVYAGMGWSIYSIVQNTKKYKRFRDAYILALAGEPQDTGFDNLNDLKQIRDGFDKNRQLSFVAAILVYGVQGAEAFVNAHLKTFDVSDDLSLQMKVKPAFETGYLNETTMGVGLNFQFQKRVEQPKVLILP